MIKTTGQSLAAELGLAIAGYDYEPVAKQTINALGNGIAAEDNVKILWAMGGSVADIIRSGMVMQMGQPDWAASIVSGLTSAVLAAMNDSLAGA